jgi:hypothetical protein
MTMPNFLIIGAEKSGTTALYHHLRQHPQIYMSPVKEPNFFTYEEGQKPRRTGPGYFPTEPVTDIDAYRRLFKEVSDETAIGEASASYLANPETPTRIRRYIPDAKLIAILRNPVERAYSNFLHARWLGFEPITDFARALQEEETRIQNGWGGLWRYKTKGFYYSQLKRYFDTFERRQIRVYLYEDFRADPSGILQDIFVFLNVDTSFVPDTTTATNVSGVPKSRVLHSMVIALRRPTLKRWIPDRLIRELREPIRNLILAKPPRLSPEVRSQLIELYREDILRLQDLIGRDLSRWLK